MKKKRILLIGNYNVGNIGDDSLLEVSKKYCEKYFSDFEVKVMAPQKPYDYVIFPAGIRSFFTFKWIKSLYAFSRSEYLIFAGGGILNPEEYKSLYIWGLQIVLAKLFKLKVVLLANSVPVSNSKFLKYLLKKVDFITVRDKSSFDFLNRLGLDIEIRKTLDLAFLLEMEGKTSDLEFDTDDFITLNLREYKKLDNEYIKELFLEIIEYVTKKTNLSVYLLPFEESDLRYLRNLNKLVASNGKVFLLPFESDVLITALKKSKLNISERLHPNLFSVGLSKDFIALSYSYKVKSLLTDIGYGMNVLDLTLDPDPILLTKMIASKLETEDNRLLVKNDILKKQAEDNFRLLELYIKNS